MGRKFHSQINVAVSLNYTESISGPDNFIWVVVYFGRVTPGVVCGNMHIHVQWFPLSM